MKKNTKFLVLLLALLMMCLCLTGCDELDNMKEHQAMWVEKGDTSALIYKGVEYKKVDVPNPPNPMNIGYYDSVTVTDPDVPVLLAERFSVHLDLTENENFIFGGMYKDYTLEHEGIRGVGAFGSSMYSSYVYFGGDPYDIDVPYDDDMYYETEEVLYCKADIYDDVMKKIEDGIQYTGYCYDYYTYNEELGYDECFIYDLTDEEVEIIDNIIKTVEPLENAYHDDWYMFSLYQTSEDGMFYKDTYDVYKDDNGNYTILEYSNDVEYTYEVPEDLEKTFDEFCNRGVLMM